jgi:hypothetical protein
MSFSKIFAAIILALLPFNILAQNSLDDIGYCKNEVGIDLANIITVLSKKPESYLLSYKRHFSERNAIRCGLDVEWSTSSDGYKGLRTRVGYEWDRTVRSWRWRLSYGADASFLYRANNFQTNKTVGGGIHPFIGFAHYFARQFSIATELNLNLFCSKRIKPGSFNPDDNKAVFDMSIGSVGMLLICYHF